MEYKEVFSQRVYQLRKQRGLNQKELDDVYASARFCADSIVGQMAACRRISDTLETMVDKACWPVPTYSDILFY